MSDQDESEGSPAQSRRPHRREAPSTKKSTAKKSLILPLLCCVVGTAIVADRLTGTPQVTPLTQLIAFYPALAMPCIAIAVVAAITRRWPLLSVSLIVAAVILATSWPSQGNRELAADGARIRVVASNVYVGAATQALADKLATEAVPTDLLLVEECTDECAKALASVQMVSLFPYRHIDAQPGARGAAILSRTPLVDLSPLGRPIARDGALAMPSAQTEISSHRLTVKVAHPFPPIPLDLGQWRTDLEGLADYAATTKGPLIIGGDFNATVYHRPFRAILDTGLSDALAANAGTWPSGLPSLIAAPIDHILIRSPLAVADSGTWSIEGTDHRTVWADLQLPR